MDKDGDGQLTADELAKWIDIIDEKSAKKELDEEWRKMKMKKDGKLDFKTYKARSDEFNAASDEKKWALADLDGDQLLTKGEFADFFSPQGKEHMKPAEILEAFNGYDKNSDGVIDKEEYLNELWPENDGKKKMPKHVAKEMEKFTEIDTDNDGKVTMEQIKDLLLPPGYNYAHKEASILIKKADTNKDGKISKEEMLKKQKLFKDSQATDYGEAIVYHNEF